MPKEIQKIKEEDTMEEEEFEEIHLEGEEEVNFTGIKETMEVMVIPIFLVLIAHKKKKKKTVIRIVAIKMQLIKVKSYLNPIIAKNLATWKNLFSKGSGASQFP